LVDFLYKQSLDTIAADILANVSALSDLPTGSTLPVRYLDWEDVVKHGGVTMRWVEEYPVARGGTNERDLNVYPCILCVVIQERLQLTNEATGVGDFLQAVRRRYSHQRRLSAVSDSGTNEIVCTVERGPRAPRDYRDKNIQTMAIMAWFIESRG